MVNTHLPQDFKDFLNLLNENEVRYLLVGGYAVGYHGYPRATADMDIWIAVDPDTAERMVEVMMGFGFAEGAVTHDVFLNEKGLVRMGVPPLRLEVLMGIDGVDFDECYERRVNDTVDGVGVKLISMMDLRQDKTASGRLKDLSDALLHGPALVAFLEAAGLHLPWLPSVALQGLSIVESLPRASDRYSPPHWDICFLEKPRQHAIRSSTDLERRACRAQAPMRRRLRRLVRCGNRFAHLGAASREQPP